MSSLYPDGSVRDCPWYLGQALTQAFSILNFMELREEDQPPEEIWLDAEALAGHFEYVKNKWKSGNSGSEWETIENAGPMQENDIAKEMRRRASK